MQLEKNERIEAFVTVRDFNQPDTYVAMVTKKGTIKKTELIAFSHPRSIGIIAIKLNENDKLIDAQLIEKGNDVIVATRNGFANRFSEDEVRATGRNTHGVKAISLRPHDEVVAMVIVKRQGTILAISENGYGKRTYVENYKKTHRGSKGVITIKTTQRNGHLISLMEVVDNDDLMIITKNGIVIRQPVEKISIIGRATQGVKLINLYEGDKVHDIARIAAEDETIDSDKLMDETLNSHVEEKTSENNTIDEETTEETPEIGSDEKSIEENTEE